MSDRIWDSENKAWVYPAREELKAAALDAMKLLTDDERIDVIFKFCRSCGCDDPHCQCWNDD